jgi:hypothetical protein
VTEHGDRVTNSSRAVPISALLRLDLAPAQPALFAVISNAVLEGGPPFALTVHSASGSKQADGSYRFSGDYLREVYTNGSQYLFDWIFSTRTNGDIVWNGATYWAGGHIWYVGITNLSLVPVPWLDITPTSASSIQLSWATNFGDYLLESTAVLPGLSWNGITNGVTNSGARVSITLDTGPTNTFYRLRRP